MTVRTASFSLGGAASFFRLGSISASSSSTGSSLTSLTAGIVDLRFLNFAIRSGDCVVSDLESLCLTPFLSTAPLPWDIDDFRLLVLSFANILTTFVRYPAAQLFRFSSRGRWYMWVEKYNAVRVGRGRGGCLNI